MWGWDIKHSLVTYQWTIVILEIGQKVVEQSFIYFHSLWPLKLRSYVALTKVQTTYYSDLKWSWTWVPSGVKSCLSQFLTMAVPAGHLWLWCCCHWTLFNCLEGNHPFCCRWRKWKNVLTAWMYPFSKVSSVSIILILYAFLAM